jgi:hypothetical protein
MLRESKEELDESEHQGGKFCKYKHKHDKLEQIFSQFWQNHAVRDSFPDLVFRLVLFHQSIPCVDRFPNKNDISPEQRLVFLDPHLLKLMVILMKADSSSYNYIYDNYGNIDQCRAEIENNSRLMLEIAEEHLLK